MPNSEAAGMATGVWSEVGRVQLQADPASKPSEGAAVVYEKILKCTFYSRGETRREMLDLIPCFKT